VWVIQHLPTWMTPFQSCYMGSSSVCVGHPQEKFVSTMLQRKG